MKRFLTFTLVLSLTFSFALSASARKARKSYEERAGDAGASLGMSFPITDDGNGFLLRAWGGYNLLDHLDVALTLGMASDEDSRLVPSNPVVSVGSSIWPAKMKRGWGAHLAGRLNLGLGLFGIDNDQRKAAALGMVTSLSWLRYMSEHLVIAPRLRAGLSLGAIHMGGSVSPQIGVPIHHTEGRETEVAIRYNFSLGTGWGDRRGGLSFGIGMTGLSELTTDVEENRFTLDLGIGVRFRVAKQNRLRISAGLSIPLSEHFLGTSVIIGGLVSWGYSVEIYDEEKEAGGGEATGWSVPYGIWQR